MSEFGFSNDRTNFDAVVAWRDAAVADGWNITPTYKHEDVQRASHLEKDGFVASVLTREGTIGSFKYEASICVWGPDGLVVETPTKYEFEAIKRGLRHCNYCGADDVPTRRVGFAGRTCMECLPEQRKRLEYPGWTE